MNKLIPYAIIAILIVGAVFIVSVKLRSSNETVSTSDVGPSAVPVSQIKLDSKTSINSAIDAELGQMDKELQGVSEADFDSSVLFDTQLGL